MTTKLKIALACLVAAFLLTGLMDYQDANDDSATYCEMTALFEQTKGQYGWPDYRGNAAEVCNE